MYRATAVVSFTFGMMFAVVALGQDPPVTRSTAALSQRLGEIGEERAVLTKLSASFQELKRFVTDLSTALPIATIDPLPDTFEINRKDVLASLNTLRGMDPTTEISESTPAWQAIETEYNKTRQTWRAYQYKTGLPNPQDYQIDEDAARLVPELLEVERGMRGSIRTSTIFLEFQNFYRNYAYEHLSSLDELQNTISPDGFGIPQAEAQSEIALVFAAAPVKLSTLLNLVDRSINELEGLEPNKLQIAAGEERKRLIEQVGAAGKKVNDKIAILKKNEEDLKIEYDSVDNSIKLAEAATLKAKEQQGELDLRLFWAILAMMGVLLSLFLALRLFSDQTQRMLIEERTLMEIVSMAFVLLTIIILATGGRLKEDSLGTLLGTIVGYIFGRRMLEGNRDLPAVLKGQRSVRNRSTDRKSPTVK